jgi:hypothetical protein
MPRHKARLTEVQRLASQFYRAMPGASPVPSIIGGELDGHPAWGEVEDTDHWQFCYAIAVAIVSNNVSTFVGSD